LPVGLLALVTYAGAAVAAAWPALGSFGSSFVSLGARGFGEAAAGDHLQTVYRFWLVGHQLEQGEAPWRDPYSFQPLVEPQIALGGWPFGVPFWPLEAAFGPVVAWNTLLLAGIVAAGLLTFSWLRALELPPAAALVGGLAFAVAPYRLEQSGEHLLGWIAILLPLTLLAVERARAARSRPRAHLWAAAGAVALASVPLSGQVHLAIGAIPLVAAYAAVRFERAAFWWAAAGAAAATGIGLLIRYTLIAGSIEAGGRSLGEVRQFEAGWGDLFSRDLPRAGDPFATESFVYSGWLTPVLALAGLILLLRGRRRLAVVLGLAAIVPLLLAVGTNFPAYSPLWRHFSPFRFPRVPERLVPIAALALAALAAFALARLFAALGTRRTALAGAAALVLVGADLSVQPFRATAADEGNRAYAAVPSAGRLLELPLFEPGINFGAVYNYYALQAPRERPGGYSTLAPPRAFDWFFALNRLSCGAWLPGDEETLRSRGAGPVLFHAGLYDQSQTAGGWFAWQALQERGYRPVAEDGPVTLLVRGFGPPAEAPLPEPPHGEIVFCEGWRHWTMSERQAPFWIYGRGRLELDLAAPGMTAAGVWVDGQKRRTLQVAGAAAVTVRLRGEGWHVVMLEVPKLLGTNPPRGLRLARLGLP